MRCGFRVDRYQQGCKLEQTGALVDEINSKCDVKL